MQFTFITVSIPIHYIVRLRAVVYPLSFRFAIVRNVMLSLSWRIPSRAILGISKCPL